MKQSERQHLKDNELAILLGQANDWRQRNQKSVTLTVVIIAVVAVGVIGFMAWRDRVDTAARQMLAEAMVVYEARVMAAPPPDATGNATPAAPTPNTYPTEQAKLEAALPKFRAAAEAYPSTDTARTARYQAASILVGLNRYDEAIAEYDKVLADSDGLLAQMARLGKAEAQLRANNYDAAIASFKELSERTDGNLPKEAMLLELARAYRLAGNDEEAKKTLNQIVEQHADSPFASEARSELQKFEG